METTTTAPLNVATNYAGFGSRLVAWIIDVIIIAALQSFVVMPVMAMLGLGIASQIENSGEFSDAEAIGMVGAIIAAASSLFIITFAISILYFAILESSKSQGSVGKMALGIKVVDMDGQQVSFGKALLRSIGKIISGMIMYIGYLMAAFTDKKQGLHDMIAGTLVVKK